MANRKRVVKKKEAAGDEKSAETAQTQGKRPMGPAGCRSFIRKELVKALPQIVVGFVEEAQKGSCPHLKLATELLTPEKKRGSRKDAAVRKMLRELGNSPKTEKPLL